MFGPTLLIGEHILCTIIVSGKREHAIYETGIDISCVQHVGFNAGFFSR